MSAPDFQLPTTAFPFKMKTTLLRVSVLALGLLPRLASACEGCKSSSLDEGGAPNAIGMGFGASVYFLMGMLLLIAGVLGWQMMKQFRAVEEGWRAQEAGRNPVPVLSTPTLRDQPIPGFSAPLTAGR